MYGHYLDNEKEILQDAITNVSCIYKYSDMGGRSDHIKPFAFMEQTKIEDCQQAVHRFLAKVDMTKIAEVIESIPQYAELLTVMPDSQKTFYLKLMELGLEKFRELAQGYVN